MTAATAPAMPATTSPTTRRTAAGRNAGLSTPTTPRCWRWSSSRRTSSRASSPAWTRRSTPTTLT
eukprot:3582134-Alexandrium_andersonii.AAC.1